MMLHVSALARILAVVGLAVTWSATPARGASVDQDSLIPPPPPGADCRADGQRIICHTGVVEPDRVNEPLLDLSCGVVYETSSDVRRGIRWYEASSGRIVKRFVTFDLEGTWSLSATGRGPEARIASHANSRDFVFPDPTDPDTWPTVFHGAGFTLWAPGFGVIALVSQQEGYDPDADAHGVAVAIGKPKVESELCAALGA